MKFRNMAMDDVAQIVEIENSVFDNPWPHTAFESCNLDESFVLEDNNRIIGYLLCMIAMDECSIINTAVLKSEQGKGLGSLMFGNLFSIMKQKGVFLYYLDVRVSNIAAIALYQKLGFRKIAQRKSYYTNPDEDALVMFLDRFGDSDPDQSMGVD